MAKWLIEHSTAISVWAGALCTFAIYSVLYKENKFYRLFEHIFIGIYAGYSVYTVWSEILYPKWWQLMVDKGQWYWILAAVAGSMFYFMYSKKHAWISRVIFGLFMGFAAGGIFREFYETYFPQMASSMKTVVGIDSVTGKEIHGWGTVTVVIFYMILFSAMSYFFFSFEHKNEAIRRTAAAGRWFLMIGFGAMFGATVMGRMTLFIGRLNFLVSEWAPEVRREAIGSPLWFTVVLVSVIGLAAMIWLLSSSPRRKPKADIEK